MGKVVIPPGFDLEVTRHWYLIANRTGAVIYGGQLGKSFHFVQRLKNPGGNRTASELGSSRPGRASARGGARHSNSLRTTHHEHAAEKFAKKIAKILDRAVLNNEFTDIVILAEPHFLGLMNQEFSKHIQAHLVLEIPREWHDGSDAELEQFLQVKMQVG